MDLIRHSTPKKNAKSISSFSGSFDSDIFSERHSSVVSSSSDSNCGHSQVSELEQAALATVLQNCYDELYVLLAVFPFSEKDLIVPAPDYKTLEERLKTNRLERLDEVDTEITDERKFQRDLSMICDLIKKSHRELWNSGSYLHLITSVDYMEKRKEEEELFMSQYAFNIAYKHQLMHLIEEGNKRFKKAMTKMDDNIDGTIIKLGYVGAVSSYEAGYVRRWEKCRRSQNRRIISSIQDTYLNAIEDTRQNIDLEGIAHNEIQTFIEEQSKEYLEQTQIWLTAYDQEVERLDMEIYNLKNKQEQLVESFEALQKEYESRKEQIIQWLAYKEEKRKEEEERLRMEKAAIRIQAWWRGVMVRRCLGKYRKKKGKKGKGKDKKGKGGKGKTKK